MACSASPNIVAKKKSCFNIIRGANSILFGMSLADAARVAQEVKIWPYPDGYCAWIIWQDVENPKKVWFYCCNVFLLCFVLLTFCRRQDLELWSENRWNKTQLWKKHNTTSKFIIGKCLLGHPLKYIFLRSMAKRCFTNKMAIKKLLHF